ncbi:hypothetical protein BU24DRAFT_418865 [Aaosphaeria arxii CBS 175.79]|uniref:RanBP2-type domain-containing protein n=1 Tax=Aaosphaeria arxii CBS 175.79 TaxID=1450172 RepID=A0A6A5Y1C0_9PLEO|nr:uncharacterized protein BU24DRAFT_418865 [Aaosphaeria arxii CBS 175.79]KAF2019278.1 hypothetical protein BU24DRAFT_418865 [Aaosphaeria arxii CBS 175.79]
MEIPRGHAMLPLNDADFLDFVFNYFKAEYAPIRSIWSTATATPRHSERWVGMGHELSPLGFRPANAQAQKDLESLDYFIRLKNLDAGFVRGLVVRYAKYEQHERLEKKLYESNRLDLMVRKALKEKHLINSLWPSPAPRNIQPELLQQGVKVRQWYGDMFYKYFKLLHSVDDFKLRPEVDAKIKSSTTLMLVPFVDHLVFGTIDPILPIVAKGAGYSNAAAWEQKDRLGTFGEPDRFEIRFDAPADITDTHTRSVVRQSQCMKCGSKRDVKVIISIDPNPGPTTTTTSARPSHKQQNAHTPGPRRNSSKTAQRYSPGYAMPSSNEPNQSTAPPQPDTSEDRPPSPPQKKQCPRCTFLNHPDLTACEMCSADLPDTLVTKPASPVAKPSKSSHSHSASVPPPSTAQQKKPEEPATRPTVNRHSLSASLFSIFPFNQQQQTEHHANLPPAQQMPKEPEMTQTSPAIPPKTSQKKHVDFDSPPSTHHQHRNPSKFPKPPKPDDPKPSPPNLIDDTPGPSTSRDHQQPPRTSTPDNLTQSPELAMLPMTPPPQSSTSTTRPVLPGMPQNLMDDYVPVSPSYLRDNDDEDAGWGEMSREEAIRADDGSDDDEEDDGEFVDGRRSGEGLIDLDEVAREEKGVWGDRSDDEDEDEEREREMYTR